MRKIETVWPPVAFDKFENVARLKLGMFRHLDVHFQVIIFSCNCCFPGVIHGVADIAESNDFTWKQGGQLGMPSVEFGRAFVARSSQEYEMP